MTTKEFNTSIVTISKSLKPFAMRLTRDLDDAKDLLQETLIKAFTYRDKFSEGTNLKAWMYVIMKNTFITNYQKILKKNTFIDTTNSFFYLNSPLYSTNNTAITNFAFDDINKALTLLQDEYKVPFIMYYNGYKYFEIAEKLNIPIGTVKNRIHIARKELKDMLSMYNDD
ncbi:MAG: RNA polymerase sigma factor [Cytophagales bacterium]|nr:RNA polymerase sigma factor [Cytophagales bacterium]